MFPFAWLFLGLFVYTALDIFLRQLQIAIPKKPRSYFRFGHVCFGNVFCVFGFRFAAAAAAARAAIVISS